MPPFTVLRASFVFLILSVGVLSEHVIVDTTYGKVRGFSDDSNGVTKFLGIPFAKPPVGSLRFMKPEQNDGWESSEILDVLQFKPSCEEVKFLYEYFDDEFNIYPSFKPVTAYENSEDCLYLNIFLPPGHLRANNKNENRAVMVFIHGGGYLVGNSIFYPCDTLVSQEDVIVVTFNYRVGLYGFAVSDDGLIPGNMGLFDQVLALRWVNENIAAFGGDTSRITIFGESAGADSVLNHLASSLSAGLFHGVISQSPPAFTRLKSKKDLYTKVVNMMQPKCGSDKASKELLQCMQDLSAEEINDLSNEAILDYGLITIDGEFLTENPSDTFAKGAFNKPRYVIIGYTGDDGDSLVGYFGNWTTIVQEGMDMEEVKGFLPMVIDFFFQRNSDESGSLPLLEVIVELLRKEYFPDVTDPFKVARGLIDASTDSYFASKCFEVADAMLQHGVPVYLYKFDHLTVSKYEQLNAKMPLSAGHGHDEFYEFFGVTYDSKKTGGISITDSERQLSKSFMKAFGEAGKTR